MAKNLRKIGVFTKRTEFMHLQVINFFCVSQVRNEFYKDTQGAMIVYDASDRASFDALDSWMAEMKSDIGNPKDMENIVFVVCANKVFS